MPGLEEFFAANSFDRVKPFFYVQHKIPRGTVGGRFQSGQDSGRTTTILSRYPNVVGFNGHKHRTATEELSLWQGAFTQIQAPEEGANYGSPAKVTAPEALLEGAPQQRNCGRELHGGLQIMNVGCQHGMKVRVRFGESVAETLVDVGERGASNDHAIRDGVYAVPHMGGMEIGNVATGNVFVASGAMILPGAKARATCVTEPNETRAGDPGFADYGNLDWRIAGFEFERMGLYDDPRRFSPAVKFGPDVCRPAPPLRGSRL